MLQFVKIHWFGLIVTIFSLLYVTIFLLVLFAPRQDELNRGFIPCTQNMVSEMFSCTENKAWCMAKTVVKNGWCDTKVVWKGFSSWINGKQSTPWENYLFTPKLLTTINTETEISPELEQYYQENENIEAQMKALELQRLELDNELNTHFDQMPQPQQYMQDMENITDDNQKSTQE